MSGFSRAGLPALVFRNKMTISTLTYDISSLLKRIETESLYVARNIENQQGEAQLDEFGITLNDHVFVTTIMRSVSADVFSRWLSPNSRTLTEDEVTALNQDIFEFDKSDSGDIKFAIKTDSNFDINTLPALDIAVEDYIVFATLYRWFLKSGVHLRGYRELLAGLKSLMDEAEGKLLGLAARRINLKRTYKFY